MTATLHPAISRAEYDALAALNWSRLRNIRRSPLHYQHLADHPRAPTPAMLRGVYAHVAVLEPERWAAQYVPEPVFGDLRTREAKAAREDWRASHVGREWLPADEHERACAIAAAVAERHDFPVLRECAIVWHQDGVECKVLIDSLGHDQPEVHEFKTTADILAFERRAADLGYHRQAAWTRLAVHALTGVMPPVRIVAVEQDPPHDVGVGMYSDDALATGEREVLECLARYRECVDSGVWPGAMPAEVTLELPRWYRYGDEDESGGEDVTFGAEVVA